MKTPIEIAYYYKVRWGGEREFRDLFVKNHLAVLSAQKTSGRLRDIRMYEPKFHGEGRADWHFMVVLTFADWAAVGASVDEAALARQLFPDEETFLREERRRFELVEAHWDVVLKPVALP